jgi:hypothetical protein
LVDLLFRCIRSEIPNVSALAVLFFRVAGVDVASCN